MSEQEDRNRLKDLGFKSKALWNTFRLSGTVAAGSAISMFFGDETEEAANRQGINHAHHLAETALGNHIIEGGAIGLGSAVVLGAVALTGYVFSSDKDWIKAREAREDAQIYEWLAS